MNKFLKEFKDRGYFYQCTNEDDLSKLLDKRPSEFTRKGEADFKDNQLVNLIDQDQAMFNAMTKYPKIIERPIIVKSNKAVIGRPPENIMDLI